MTDLEGPLNLIQLHRSFFPPEKRDSKIAEAAEALVKSLNRRLGHAKEAAE